jgi:ribose 5-phosphate isomerase A
LGEKLASGALRDIRGVPTSENTARIARQLGIPLTTLTELGSQAQAPHLDLAVDGADEVDPALNLIKGLGKALLREKIIEMHADEFIVIVDERKLSGRLGMKAPLPIEIVIFEAETQVRWLNTLASRAELWLDENGRPVVSDNGNYLALAWFEDGIADVYQLAKMLAERPGIVEHGLFLDMASKVLVAGKKGVRVLERE